jgi:hypothetical protein
MMTLVGPPEQERTLPVPLRSPELATQPHQRHPPLGVERVER